MEWFKRVKKSFKDLKKKSATEGESIIEVLDKKYVDMCVGVCESLKDFLNELSSRYKTKAPNDVRHVMQTIVTAIMAHFD